MGLLGPSAVEHTTGVVFRVGTPGRLAGRCLWPSLSSRKSKATGVVAIPFSLSLLFITFFVFHLPSILSLSFFPFFLPRSLHLYLYLVLLLFLWLSLLTATFSRRACRACVSKIFFLRCARHTRASGTWEGVIQPHPSQRCTCQNNKKQVKVSQSLGNPSLVLCTPIARAPGSFLLSFTSFGRPSRVEGS